MKNILIMTMIGLMGLTTATQTGDKNVKTSGYVSMMETKEDLKGVKLNDIEREVFDKLNKLGDFEIVKVIDQDVIAFRDLRVTIYPTNSEEYIDFSISNGYYNSSNEKMLKEIDNIINLDDVICVEAKDILKKGLINHDLKYNDKHLESYISYDYDTTAVRIKTKGN